MNAVLNGILDTWHSSKYDDGFQVYTLKYPHRLGKVIIMVETKDLYLKTSEGEQWPHEVDVVYCAFYEIAASDSIALEQNMTECQLLEWLNSTPSALALGARMLITLKLTRGDVFNNLEVDKLIDYINMSELLEEACLFFTCRHFDLDQEDVKEAYRVFERLNVVPTILFGDTSPLKVIHKHVGVATSESLKDIKLSDSTHWFEFDGTNG